MIGFIRVNKHTSNEAIELSISKIIYFARMTHGEGTYFVCEGMTEDIQVAQNFQTVQELVFYATPRQRG